MGAKAVSEDDGSAGVSACASLAAGGDADSPAASGAVGAGARLTAAACADEAAAAAAA